MPSHRNKYYTSELIKFDFMLKWAMRKFLLCMDGWMDELMLCPRKSYPISIQQFKTPSIASKLFYIVKNCQLLRYPSIIGALF